MRTRKARLPDARRIHELIEPYARKDILLPRSLAEICENIRDFTVVESNSDVIGCGALHLYGLDLAEIRSIAVAPTAQGLGAGRRLVRGLLREARRHQVGRVCLFTRIPDYFARLGFVGVSHQSLPEKIWKDCLKCPRFNCCDETAMIFARQSPSAHPVPAGQPSRPEARQPLLNVLPNLPG